MKPGLARLVLQAEASAPEPLHISIVPISIRYQPAPLWRSRITNTISPPLQTVDHRQSTDKQTAQAITTALEQALLKGLEG